MSLLAPAALGLAAMAIPLIVLYMLRSRRRRVEVSSVMLWRDQAQTVTSAVPWKRLEVSPLLLAQLLILGTLVFALSRPFFAQASVLGPHSVLIVDVSGSMAAAGRFDDAVSSAADLAADVSDANLVSVIEAGATPRVAGSFLRTPQAVRAALESLAQTGGPADLDAAVRLGRGLATPDRPTNLVLLSDGGATPLTTEPIVDADHLRFSATADNLSIASLSVEPTTEGVVRLFVNVSNHTGVAEDVTVGLDVNGLPSGTVDVEVGPLADASTIVPLDAAPGDVITATRHGDDDGLALDDRATVVVAGGPERTVAVVGDGSTFLDVLIDITPGFTAAPDDAGDVLIVDGGPIPEIDRPTWLIRPETPPGGVEFSELVTNVAATFQAPGEPLLDSVDLSGLIVSEAQVAETFSWLPIVRAGDVPLVLLGAVDGHRVVYFTFDISHSNLGVQVGFPIMGARILEWLAGTGATAAQTAVAGTPIPISAPAGSAVEIARDGELVAELDGTALAYDRTGMPGVYRVAYVAADGARTAGPVAVRTFDRAESVAGSRDVATVGPAFADDGSGTLVREWGPPLLTAVIALMGLEWWLGHRRRRTASGEVFA